MFEYKFMSIMKYIKMDIPNRMYSQKEVIELLGEVSSTLEVMIKEWKGSKLKSQNNNM